MPTYVKKEGNTAGLGNYYDLYDVNTTAYGAAISTNLNNFNLYQAGITANDGHQKIFSVVVIKNDSGDVGTLLEITEIEILKNYDATAGTGTAINGSDAFSIDEVFKTTGVGNGVATAHPFMGIQSQVTPWTNEIEYTKVLTDTAATSATRCVITRPNKK